MDPLDRDPGYIELNKRNTRDQDLKDKVIHDYYNRSIIKIEDNHG